MQTVTSTRQGLAIAWRAAKSYSVDGTESWLLRTWRWPGYFVIMTMVTAFAAGDTVWQGTAAINVRCRSRRPARVQPGLVAVFGLLTAVVLAVCWELTRLTWRAAGYRQVNTWAFAATVLGWFLVLLGPIVAAQVRPTWVREHCALRQWRRRLKRRGRVTEVAVSAAAWPMRQGAFSALLPAVMAESRQAGQVVLLHARSPVIADIYRRKGARTHPQFPTVLAWF